MSEKMVCKKCGSMDITTNTFSEVKRRSMLSILLDIILTIITCGIWLIVILIKIFRGRKSKVKTVNVCNLCGFKWNI